MDLWKVGFCGETASDKNFWKIQFVPHGQFKKIPFWETDRLIWTNIHSWVIEGIKEGQVLGPTSNKKHCDT